MKLAFLGPAPPFRGGIVTYYGMLARVLALHADPDNAALQHYAEEIADKRSRGEPTVPMGLARELETNPFLRADTAEMQQRWGGNTPAETFAAIRAGKDGF